LDLLILQTLQWGAQHGYGISQAIRANSGDILQVDTGSLYPALHRLERQKMDYRGLEALRNKQRVRVYRLTATGKSSFSRSARAGSNSPTPSPECSVRPSERATHEIFLASRPANNKSCNRNCNLIWNWPSAISAAAVSLQRMPRVRLIANSVTSRSSSKSPRSMGHPAGSKNFLQDLRYGARMLRKSPGFAIIAILDAGPGYRANTTNLQLIRAVLLNPLPGAGEFRSCSGFGGVGAFR